MRKYDLAIILLSRLGDFVQISMLLRQFEFLNKKIRYLLVCYKQDVDALHFLLSPTDPSYDLYLIDKNCLVLDEIQKDFSQYQFTSAVNLTFSPFSEFLLSKMQSIYKLGPQRFFQEKTSSVQVSDLYSQYIYSSVLEGPLNPFHLMDLFSCVLGLRLEDLPLKEEERFHLSDKIIIHARTSQDKKQWNLGQWTEFIYHLLWKNPQVTIYCAGSIEDISFYTSLYEHDLLKNFSERIFIHTVGMDLQKWIPIFEEYPLVIAHDSFFSHFANHHHLQCFIITLGSTRVWESSPYGKGHIIASPKMDCYPCLLATPCSHQSCKLEMSAQSLAMEVTSVLQCKGKNLQTHLQSQEYPLKPYSLYLTSFQEGYFFLESLTPPTKLFSLQKLYFVLWNFLFFDKEIEIEQEEYTFLHSYVGVLDKLVHYLHAHMERTKEVSETISLRDFFDNQQSFFQDIIHLKENHPYLYPILNFYYVRFLNMAPTKVIQNKEKILEICQEFQHALLLFWDLIQIKKLKGTQNDYLCTP